jgi:hypothetical protein
MHHSHSEARGPPLTSAISTYLFSLEEQFFATWEFLVLNCVAAPGAQKSTAENSGKTCNVQKFENGFHQFNIFPLIDQSSKSYTAHGPWHGIPPAHHFHYLLLQSTTYWTWNRNRFKSIHNWLSLGQSEEYIIDCLCQRKFNANENMYKTYIFVLYFNNDKVWRHNQTRRMFTTLGH